MNGLGPKPFRRSPLLNLLGTLNTLKVDVCCLQEHHIRLDDLAAQARVVALAKFAGWTAYLSCAASTGPIGTGGTMILLREQFVCTDVKFSKALNGRVCIIDLRTAGEKFRIICSYAPALNTAGARLAYMKNLEKHVNKHTILTGDFNCVPDTALDLRRSSKTPYSNGGAKTLSEIVNKNDLTDTLRQASGMDFEFTHGQKTRGGGYCLSRIDQCYNPSHIQDAHWNTEILDTVAGSDHCAVLNTLELRSANQSRGKDLFTIKEDIIFQPRINSELASINAKHLALFDTGADPNDTKKSLLKEVRKYLKKNSKKQKSAINKEIAKLELTLEAMHTNQICSPCTDSIHARSVIQDQLAEERAKLRPPSAKHANFSFKKEECMSAELFQTTFHKTLGGSFITSLNAGINWADKATVPPKDTHLPKQSKKVHEEGANYFEELARPEVQNDDTKKARDIIYELLEKWGVDSTTADKVGADITTEEVEKISSHLPLGKSAGPDRIPNAYWKTFSKQLAPLLTACYNQSRNSGIFPQGFSDGIVAILFKKGNRTDIRNYRPITLLNGDYKILTRILAKRMLEIVSQFVSGEQIGFMPRTFIAEATNMVKMIQAQLDNIIDDEGGIMFACDMEKAFDRCSWGFLRTAIKKLRFTPGFQQWFDVLYNESAPPKRKIYANGYLSREYSVYLGTAQGCPLSPLIFLIITEGFCRLVYDNDVIKSHTGWTIEGIKIGGKVYKLSMFADDALGLIREKDMPAFCWCIKIYCLATNMKENETKRQLLAMGKLKKRNPLSFPGTYVYNPKTKRYDNEQWVKDGSLLIYLGVPYGNKISEEDFYWSLYGAAKKIMTQAKIGSMSHVGRHTILNASVYGKFRYWFWSLLPSKPVMEALKSDAKHFLWRAKHEIKKDERGTKGHYRPLMNPKAALLPCKKGGAGIMDLDIHSSAYPAKMVINYLGPRQAQYQPILDMWLGKHKGGGLLMDLTRQEKKSILNNIPLPFVRQWIKNFWELNIKPHPDVTKYASSAADLVAVPLHQNPFFKIPARLSRTWGELGMTTFGSLVNATSDKLFTLPELKNYLRGTGAGPPPLPKLNGETGARYSARVSRIAKNGEKIINLIPPDIKQLLEQTEIEFEKREVVQYTEHHQSEDGNWISTREYGILNEKLDKLWQLNVDTSGFYTPVGPPENISKNDWKDYEFSKVSLWGKPSKKSLTRPILGPSETTFPRDGMWTMQGDLKNPFHLSELGVKQITKKLTAKKTGRPNCEKKWNEKFQHNKINFEREVWPYLGTGGITNPTDEKQSHKLLQRKLAVDNNDSRNPSNNCRICKAASGSMLHHVICKGMEKPKKFATRLLLKAGVKRKDIHATHTWLACIKKNGKHLPPFARAIIRWFRRVNYRHFTAVATDHIKYDPDRVISDLSRLVMSRILSVQFGLQKFIISRRHTALKKVLPNSINKTEKLGGIGNTDIHTGVLTVKRGIKRILQNQEAWSDMYSRKKNKTPH